MQRRGPKINSLMRPIQLFSERWNPSSTLHLIINHTVWHKQASDYSQVGLNYGWLG